MSARPLPAFMLALAACTPAGPAPVPVGIVEANSTRYPVEALANGTWRVRVGDALVTCLHPDESACYWSVRNHLQAQLLDDPD